MPRTTKVDSPGCPPLRALTFDVLGLVKVIEAKDRQGGAAQVVERWGEPDFSKSVLAASINDRRVDPGWSNERVIQTPSTDGRIVVVQDGDHPAHRNKVQEVLKIMETDLGDSGINHQLCKVYLFISAQRVAGCLVAEPLKFAHRILSSCVNEKHISHATKGQQKPATLQFGGIHFQREIIRRGSSVDENKLSNGNCSGAIFCENETVPVACGIRAIWVTPSNRRKHIATQLLDAVRKSFLDGVVLEKNQLAFAQPTSDGKILAAKYTGITTFLVY